MFVDLETGGLQPHRPIIQAAAIAVDASLRELGAIEVKIHFDEHAADAEALRKNSYDAELWKQQAVDEQDAARSLARFFRRHATVDMISSAGRSYRVAQLVAHNGAFDGAFLRAWFDRLDRFLPAHPRVLCTVQRAAWLFLEEKRLTPPADFKLGTLCEYFGVPLKQERAHDALADVQATVELYRAMSLWMTDCHDSRADMPRASYLSSRRRASLASSKRDAEWY